MIYRQRSGAFIPRFLMDSCNGCGLCREICPGYETDLGNACRRLWKVVPANEKLGRCRSVYTAYSQNEKIRREGSSGGVVTSLLIHALETGMIDGALVTRMRRDIPWMAEAFIARKPADIIGAAGSKYCPVPIGKALKELLRVEGRYGVVGLPCHIYGLRKAQNRLKSLRRKVVFMLGLFCAGGRSHKGTDALLRQAGFGLAEVCAIRYRGSGWPGVTHAADRKGRSMRCGYEVSYPFMCLNDISRCAVCPDKTAEVADISFGDLWLKHERPHMGAGKTLCLVRSETGAALFGQALESGSLCAAPLDESGALASADREDKKKRAAARLAIAKWFGKPVPEIARGEHVSCNLKELLHGLQYYLLQGLCRNDWLRHLYFKARPKYRRLRHQIEIH